MVIENKLRRDLTNYFTGLEQELLEVVYDEEVPNTKEQVTNSIQYKFDNEFHDLLLKYTLLMMKLAEKQQDTLIEHQQNKRLKQPKATSNISFKELPITWLQQKTYPLLHWISTKAQTNLDDILYPDVINKNAPYKIETNQKVQRYLEENTLTTSFRTRNRITEEIQDILTKSETEGIGNREVGKLIQQRFQRLKTYEAERIARTEINSANNLASHQRLLDDPLVDYNQWLSTEDHRTRGQHKGDKANHIKMNGEITRIGHPFSNGLLYPGDKNGPLYEIINCRCTVVPWIPDFDKIPPTDKPYWREEDCIPLPTDNTQQVIVQLEEDKQLFQVQQGRMKVVLDELNIRPSKRQTTLDTYLQPTRLIQSTLDNYLNDITYNNTKGRFYTLDNYTPTKEEMKKFYEALYDKDVQKQIKNNTLNQLEFPDEFDKNTQKDIINFIKKYKNEKIEHGFIYDYKQSKIINGIKHGDEREVKLDYSKVSNKHKHTFTLHHHPEHGISGPSGGDIRNLLIQAREDYALISSKNELWIIKYKGSMSMSEANEIQGMLDKLLTRSEYRKKELKTEFKMNLREKYNKLRNKYKQKYPEGWPSKLELNRQNDSKEYDKMMDTLFVKEANNVRLEYLNEIGIETIRIKI